MRAERCRYSPELNMRMQRDRVEPERVREKERSLNPSTFVFIGICSVLRALPLQS